MSDFNKYMKADRVKGILCFILIIALGCAVAILGVKLSRQTTRDTLGFEAYSVGELKVVEKASEGGERYNAVEFDNSVKTAIATKDYITTDGLRIKADKNSGITYKLFFFDREGNFIQQTEMVDTDLDARSIPVDAEFVKIMITPIKEEGKEETTLGAFTYPRIANKLIVTFNR